MNDVKLSLIVCFVSLCLQINIAVTLSGDFTGFLKCEVIMGVYPLRSLSTSVLLLPRTGQVFRIVPLSKRSLTTLDC